MTRWAAIVVALYVALLVALTLPLLFWCFLPESLDGVGQEFWFFGEGVYLSWPYWFAIGLLGAAQALYLVVPVKARQNIRLRHRHILREGLAETRPDGDVIQERGRSFVG